MVHNNVLSCLKRYADPRLSMLTALAFLGGSTSASASTSSFDLAAALADQVNRIPGLALGDLNHSAAHR